MSEFNCLHSPPWLVSSQKDIFKSHSLTFSKRGLTKSADTHSTPQQKLPWVLAQPLIACGQTDCQATSATLHPQPAWEPLPTMPRGSTKMATSPQGAGSSLTENWVLAHTQQVCLLVFHLLYRPHEKSDSSPTFKPCPSEADVLGQET